jgi:hypothetical protein
MPMVDNPVWEICERMAEVQALLHDHAECGKHSASDVVAKRRRCCPSPNCCGRRCRLLPAEHAARRGPTRWQLSD